LAGTIAAYLLIGLEVFIMITPFAIYFYAIYGPVLEWFTASPLTAWLMEFFLPHLVFVDDPLIKVLSHLQVLLVVGLVLFFGAAIPLYYGRLTNKGVVRFGPYAKLRHPQYLFLALSGLGMLFYWPRFIVLIFYVIMLFVYVMLARNEEWRMKREAPGAYEQYMRSTPWMFLPGNPGGRLFLLLFGRIRPRWLALMMCFVVSMSAAILLAVAIRQYTIDTLPTTRVENLQLISVYERPPEKMQALFRQIQLSPQVQVLLESEKANMAYIMPGDYFLTGLVLEEGPRFSDAILKRYPHLSEWYEHRFQGGVRKFLRLFRSFWKTWSYFRTVYDIERFVFVRVTDFNDQPVAVDDVLKLGVKRTPVFVVDVDYEYEEVLDVIPVSGKNLWGNLPMPNF
ncbi:MAG: hypothetical protein C0618_07555, partial [Desulfuromonas sp.]